MWEHFKSLNVRYNPPQQGRRRYSVTADILAFQQCPIQYGAFGIRGYVPSLPVQLFYGTVIHQVLDRAHRHYQQNGNIPLDSDIEQYFKEVENGLKARHIRAVKNVREQALEVLKRFNSLEGPKLYPRIIDTECRLQADQRSYILHGNVDVIKACDDDESQVEIWDYKGARRPSPGDPNYQRYIFQMQVYAKLYHQKTGKRPARAVLYFLNELSGNPPPTSRPPKALVEVKLDEEEVQNAFAEFGQTVQQIEQCREKGDWGQPTNAPPEETCDACDLRWHCEAAKSFGRNYPITYP